MKLKQLTPNLMVADVRKTADFYCNRLGFSTRIVVDVEKQTYFHIEETQKDLLYAQLVRDDVEIMVQQRQSLMEDVPVFSGCEIGASISLYIVVEDVEGFYQDIRDKIDCIKPLETTWYGMKEFYIRDVDGYVLGFAEQVES